MDNGAGPSPGFPFFLPARSIGEEKAKVKRFLKLVLLANAYRHLNEALGPEHNGRCLGGAFGFRQYGSTENVQPELTGRFRLKFEIVGLSYGDDLLCLPRRRLSGW